jgi:hypothetical protein
LFVVGLLALELVPGSRAIAAPTSDLDRWTFVALDLPNRDIAYDRTRGQLLVLVSATVPAVGNHLVEVDPDSGALGRRLALPGAPHAIALSQDGTRAYVSLAYANQIAEVDLVHFRLVRRFALPLSTLGPSFGGDLVVPGPADVVVSSLHPRCCTGEQVVAFDDGVARPRQEEQLISQVMRGPTASSLYGFQGAVFGGDLVELRLGSTGVRIDHTVIEDLGGPYDSVDYAAGRVTTSTGKVVDVRTGELLGDYFVGHGPFAIDARNHNAWFLDHRDVLYRFDTRTFEQLDSRQVGFGEAHSLVDTRSGLAAADSERILLAGPAVTGAGFVLPPAPSPVVLPAAGRSVPLAASDLDAAPDGEHVYAITGTADADPNSLVEIEAESGLRTRRLPLAGNPEELTVSDDGRSAVVLLRGSSDVAEIDLTAFAETRRVTVPGGDFDTFPTDAAFVPGRHDRYAVAVDGYGPFLVTDGAVSDEPDGIPDNPNVSQISFAGDPTVLYGFETASSRHAMSTFDVHDGGLTRRTVTGYVPVTAATDAVGGRLYSRSGDVYDPARLRILGQMVSDAWAADVTVLTDRGRAVMARLDDLVEFDLASHAQVIWHQAVTSGDITDLVRVGDLVAMHTDDDLFTVVPIAPDVPTPRCAGRPATVLVARGQQPTGRADVIIGTPDADSFSGGAGNDVICGGGGDDRLAGGAGADQLYGGRGNDDLDGGTQRDRCEGQAGGSDRARRCEVTVGVP